MFQERAPPVAVGDELNLKVESVGAKGDGIAKVQGFVLFIAGTKQGENVKIRITKVLKNVGFAEVVSRNAVVQEEATSSDPDPEPQEAPKYEDSENFGEG